MGLAPPTVVLDTFAVRVLIWTSLEVLACCIYPASRVESTDWRCRQNARVMVASC